MSKYQKRAPRYEYMLVTADEYEVPVFKAGSAEGLGRILDRPGNHISRALCYGYRVRWRGEWYKIVRVDMEVNGL